MSNLNRTAAPVKPARHRLAVYGTVLGAELRNALKALGYCPASVREIVDHVGTATTASGCDVEAEDLPAIDALVVRHTENVEFESAEDWPAWTDEGHWFDDAPEEVAPHVSEPDDDHGPDDDHLYNHRPFEPTRAERVWVSSNGTVDLFPGKPFGPFPAFDHAAHESESLELLSQGLTPHDLKPISGGAPADDLYPASWLTAIPGYTDQDHRAAGHAV